MHSPSCLQLAAKVPDPLLLPNSVIWLRTAALKFQVLLQPRQEGVGRVEADGSDGSAGLVQIPPEFLTTPGAVRQPEYLQQVPDDPPKTSVLHGQRSLTHVCMDDVPI